MGRPKANVHKDDKEVVKKIPKKRGRKPKGGKIIAASNVTQHISVPNPNIVLHLRCTLADLEKNTYLNSPITKASSNAVSGTNISRNQQYTDKLETYQFDNVKSKDLPYNVLANPDNNNHNHNNNNHNNTNSNSINSMHSNSHDLDHSIKQDIKKQTINEKLRILSSKLKTDTISDTKSACFWCTCGFDNPPVYIPTAEVNGSYHCYGCFCSPECATAYLFKETIDATTKFERYSLLNYIYCEVYNHTKNIKPAPDPRYILDKFYGNLSINEYRLLLENDRLLLVINKPLTRILPEIHEDTENFLVNSGTEIATGRFRLRKTNKPTKSQILHNKFNFPKQESY